MTKQKQGGWFRESQRHSLASKGIEIKGIKPPKTPRTPKAPSKAGTAGSEEPRPKGDEVVMLCQEDEQFGQKFMDGDGSVLTLVGAVLDEADKPRVLILETEGGVRVERKPEDLRPAEKA